MTTVLDPTNEASPATIERVARPESLAGLTVGLLDISKPRGNVFLDRVEQRLAELGARVERYRKPTFTKPAPVDLRHQIATECDAVIEALADWGSCTSCSVHDITDLERRGVPGVFVASDPFVTAAEAQATALGFDAARLFVAHPIQDRTDDEMIALADGAVDELIAKLTGWPPTPETGDGVVGPEIGDGVAAKTSPGGRDGVAARTSRWWHSAKDRGATPTDVRSVGPDEVGAVLRDYREEVHQVRLCASAS